MALSASRVAQRTRVCSPGGPDVRQALERPAMLAYARRGRPITDGARACEEPGGLPACAWRGMSLSRPRSSIRAALPALIRPRPCLERLLDRRTLRAARSRAACRFRAR